MIETIKMRDFRFFLSEFVSILSLSGHFKLYIHKARSIGNRCNSFMLGLATSLL